jgi:hypothetical protein
VTANGGFLSTDRGFDTFFNHLVSFNGSAVRFPSGLDPAEFIEMNDKEGIERVIESLSREAAGFGNCVQQYQRPARRSFSRRVLECRGYGDSTAV